MSWLFKLVFRVLFGIVFHVLGWWLLLLIPGGLLIWFRSHLRKKADRITGC